MLRKIFLFIFRATALINARPWISSDRADINYFNGVLTVSLVQLIVLNDLYIVLTWISGLAYPTSYIVPVAIYVILVLFNDVWLVSKRAGIEYVKQFAQESPSIKRRLRLASVVLVLFAVGEFFLLSPRPVG